MSRIKSSTRTTLWKLGLIPAFMCLLCGCKKFPPGGSPIEVIPLGSVIDQANRIQEENAEPAKFIVYMHEFELNKPLELPESFASRPEYDNAKVAGPRGFRLSPFGQDHVRQIARQLLFGDEQLVMVERSNTSKLQNSIYRYPVNYNTELDRLRREVVVEALMAMGVENADELVVVAPAYPEGLHSDDAINAFQNSQFGGAGGGQGGFGAGGGGGGGGFGGGFGGF